MGFGGFGVEGRRDESGIKPSDNLCLAALGICAGNGKHDVWLKRAWMLSARTQNVLISSYHIFIYHHVCVGRWSIDIIKAAYLLLLGHQLPPSTLRCLLDSSIRLPISVRSSLGQDLARSR